MRHRRHRTGPTAHELPFSPPAECWKRHWSPRWHRPAWKSWQTWFVFPPAPTPPPPPSPQLGLPQPPYPQSPCPPTYHPEEAFAGPPPFPLAFPLPLPYGDAPICLSIALICFFEYVPFGPPPPGPPSSPISFFVGLAAFFAPNTRFSASGGRRLRLPQAVLYSTTFQATILGWPRLSSTLTGFPN